MRLIEAGSRLERSHHLISLSTGIDNYRAMLQMIDAGKISPKKLITGTTNLSGINPVFEEMNTFQNVGVTVITDYTA
jgi:D-arabinose 1-dehydrogenase-like Zn-dependent alcohol dehydrogenase